MLVLNVEHKQELVFVVMTVLNNYKNFAYLATSEETAKAIKEELEAERYYDQVYYFGEYPVKKVNKNATVSK